MNLINDLHVVSNIRTYVRPAAEWFRRLFGAFAPVFDPNAINVGIMMDNVAL